MTPTNRKVLLGLLSGYPTVRLASHGCGSRTQLCFRVTCGGNTAVFDRLGNCLEGRLSDEELLSLAESVRDSLDRVLRECCITHRHTPAP